MNQKHILTYILFTGLSMGYANCIQTFLACGPADAKIRQAEFSPDGTMIALLDNNGEVSIRDDRGSIQLRVHHETPITTFAFSPDSRLFALGCAEGYIEIIDPTAETIEKITDLSGQTKKPVTSLAFLDNNSLCITYAKMQVYMYMLNVVPKDIMPAFKNDKPINNIQSSPSGKLLYITQGFYIQKLMRNSIEHADFFDQIICTDFSKINENKFVEVTFDGTIRVGEFGKSGWLTIFDQNAVKAQFSPVDDGLLLVATAWQKLPHDKRSNIKLIRLSLDDNEKHQVIEFPNHDRILTSARFNHDGTKIIGITLNGPAMIFDAPVLSKSWGETISSLPGNIYKKCEIQ